MTITTTLEITSFSAWINSKHSWVTLEDRIRLALTWTLSPPRRPAVSLNFDLHNLIVSSVVAIEYSLLVIEPFMRYHSSNVSGRTRGRGDVRIYCLMEVAIALSRGERATASLSWGYGIQGQSPLGSPLKLKAIWKLDLIIWLFNLLVLCFMPPMQMHTLDGKTELLESCFGAGSRGHGVQGVSWPPLFQVRGPHMDVDPHFLWGSVGAWMLLTTHLSC